MTETETAPRVRGRARIIWGGVLVIVGAVWAFSAAGGISDALWAGVVVIVFALAALAFGGWLLTTGIMRETS